MRTPPWHPSQQTNVWKRVILPHRGGLRVKAQSGTCWAKAAGQQNEVGLIGNRRTGFCAQLSNRQESGDLAWENSTFLSLSPWNPPLSKTLLPTRAGIRACPRAVGSATWARGKMLEKFSNIYFLMKRINTKLNAASDSSNHKICIATYSGQLTWQNSQGTIGNVHEHLLRPAAGVQGEVIRTSLWNANTCEHKHPRMNCSQ